MADFHLNKIYVQHCIPHIVSCGWEYKGYMNGLYFFFNPNANEVHKEMRFTLRELRLAYVYGW